eukprot:TRINITY_DN3843_c0_g1_i1.p1 TRINITY_DN3843_c0_g1~~TRINITY_DN3843_c0_g1_i1.p1  ORF type:complete len:434 (+),score=156.71 TRINITY_DN3843_c0_g1_i1:89-1390(+)
MSPLKNRSRAGKERVKASFEISKICLSNIPFQLQESKVTLAWKRGKKIKGGTVKDGRVERGIVVWEAPFVVKGSLWRKPNTDKWDEKTLTFSLQQGVKKLGKVKLDLGRCGQDGGISVLDYPLATPSGALCEYMPMLHFCVTTKWIKRYDTVKYIQDGVDIIQQDDTTMTRDHEFVQIHQAHPDIHVEEVTPNLLRSVTFEDTDYPHMDEVRAIMMAPPSPNLATVSYPVRVRSPSVSRPFSPALQKTGIVPPSSSSTEDKDGSTTTSLSVESSENDETFSESEERPNVDIDDEDEDEDEDDEHAFVEAPTFSPAMHARHESPEAITDQAKEDKEEAPAQVQAEKVVPQASSDSGSPEDIIQDRISALEATNRALMATISANETRNKELQHRVQDLCRQVSVAESKTPATTMPPMWAMAIAPLLFIIMYKLLF